MAVFAFQDKATLKIVSYASDDSQGFANVNLANLNKLGPFASIAAAQAILEPQPPNPRPGQVAALLAKPSQAWTLTDVADALKLLIG